jgi:hypothetical protein
MDDARFAELARAFGGWDTRRGALRLLAGAVLGAPAANPVGDALAQAKKPACPKSAPASARPGREFCCQFEPSNPDSGGYACPADGQSAGDCAPNGGCCPSGTVYRSDCQTCCPDALGLCENQ